jgi:hypothetical protein
MPIKIVPVTVPVTVITVVALLAVKLAFRVTTEFTSIAPAVAVTIVRTVADVVYVPAKPGNVTVLPICSEPSVAAETDSVVPELVAVPANARSNVSPTANPETLAV